MKKAALISPKGNIFGKNSGMRDFLKKSSFMDSFKVLWSGPNLGLLTIAALFPPDWECVYLDGNLSEVDLDAGYDMVCVSAMTQQAVNAYTVLDAFRARGILTVMGGIHATILPEEAAQHADVVMAGEGEPLWQEFFRDYQNKKLRKIYREARPGSFALTDSPVPRFDLLEPYRYPLITIQTTRGCPHDCSFCAASKVFGRRYRRKSNSQILRELNMLNSLYPGRLILFADDNLFVNRRESKDLLGQIESMDIRYIAQTDVSVAQDRELLELMARSGCQWIVVGFESPSYESLQGLDNQNWKLRQMPRYVDSIKTIQSFGVGVYGTFIVGLDGDQTDIFDTTAEFVLHNNLFGANITVPTPLPGTRLREEMEKEKRILTNDWQYYTFWDVTIQPRNMTAEELEDGLLSIYLRLSDSGAVKNRLLNLKRMAKRRNIYTAAKSGAV